MRRCGHPAAGSDEAMGELMLKRQPLPTDVKSCHDLICLLFDELEARNRDLVLLRNEFKAEAARLRAEMTDLSARIAALRNSDHTG